MNVLKKRPWLLIVLLFSVMLVAWGFFITVAFKNQPEEVPLRTEQP